MSCRCHGEEIYELQSVSSLFATRKNLLIHDQVSNFQKLCTFNFSSNSSNDTNWSSSPVSISLLLHTTPFMLLHPLPQTDTQKLINILEDHHLGNTHHSHFTSAGNHESCSLLLWTILQLDGNEKCEYHVPQTFFRTWWFLEHAPAIGWRMLPPLQEAPMSADPPPPLIHSNASSNTCCTQFL